MSGNRLVTRLVVIDPQNSFCKKVPAERQQVEHNGELCVEGAWEDMERLAKMVDRLGHRLDQINVTMDSHQRWHIAHARWFDPEPPIFTIMSLENEKIVGDQFDASGKPHRIGEFTTKHPSTLTHTKDYLRSLTKGGRYPHCIWPEHCLIGTPGHNIVEPLMNSLLSWSAKTSRTIEFITKGSNPFVEHFSAVLAEVPMPNDPSTQMNMDLVDSLKKVDVIAFAGEALSHCLANTARDIAKYFGDLSKFVLLTDATSSVTGFDHLGKEFVNEMTARGMKLATTENFLA